MLQREIFNMLEANEKKNRKFRQRNRNYKQQPKENFRTEKYSKI